MSNNYLCGGIVCQVCITENYEETMYSNKVGCLPLRTGRYRDKCSTDILIILEVFLIQICSWLIGLTRLLAFLQGTRSLLLGRLREIVWSGSKLLIVMEALIQDYWTFGHNDLNPPRSFPTELTNQPTSHLFLISFFQVLWSI